MNHSLKDLAATWSGIQPVVGILVTGMLALLFLVSTVLLVVLRYRVTRIAAQLSGRRGATAKLAAELEAQALLVRQMAVDLEELRKRIFERDEKVNPPATAWPGGEPLNLNRRGQILRLSRKGKSVAEIASDLHVAQGEVELLLKVCDLSSAAAGAEK